MISKTNGPEGRAPEASHRFADAAGRLRLTDTVVGLPQDRKVGRISTRIIARRSFTWIALSALLVAASILDLGQSRFPREAAARGAMEEDGGQEDIFVHLCGPNDGEPINSRSLVFKLSTNAANAGVIWVSANGSFLYSQPFRSDLHFDAQSGLFVTSVAVDIELLHRLFPARFLDPDAAPFTITASLYNADGTRLITYGDWTGYIEKPWVEVVSLQASKAEGNGTDGVAVDEEGEEAPLGTLRVLVHTLAKDTFYFLLASPDRQLLTLSPEDPPLLRQARKLAAGSCGPETGAQEVLYLDSVSDLPWSPTYMVLWTFDFYGGWKRSAVFQVR
jgi:hypothetical protein